MRLPALVLLALPTTALARPQEMPMPAPAPQPAETMAPAPSDVVLDDRAKPLASSEQTGRILSKNEAYNLGRAADGRLGVRLGNDMSYRVTGN